MRHKKSRRKRFIPEVLLWGETQTWKHLWLEALNYTHCSSAAVTNTQKGFHVTNKQLCVVFTWCASWWSFAQAELAFWFICWAIWKVEVFHLSKELRNETRPTMKGSFRAAGGEPTAMCALVCVLILLIKTLHISASSARKASKT